MSKYGDELSALGDALLTGGKKLGSMVMDDFNKHKDELLTEVERVIAETDKIIFLSAELSNKIAEAMKADKEILAIEKNIDKQYDKAADLGKQLFIYIKTKEISEFNMTDPVFKVAFESFKEFGQIQEGLYENLWKRKTEIRAEVEAEFNNKKE